MATCICGCKQKTKGGRFMPGHDARLSAKLNKRAQKGDQRAIERLDELGWTFAHPISVLRTRTA